MSGKTVSPTINDVAREAGVSISTVSRILNDSSQVARSTVERVQEAINRLGYQPRSAARNLALRRTNTLGIMMEAIGTSFFSSVVAGAEAAAYEKGYSLLIATQCHMDNKAIPALGPFNTDGLLAVNISLTESSACFFNNNFPVVTLYQPAEKSLDIPFITIENKEGVFRLIEHLIVQHGIQKIGFLRGLANNHDAYWREQGYLAALETYNIPVDPELMAFCGYNSNRARNILLNWHSQGKMPQAIFTGSDDTALYVMLTLNELGLRVPEDVSVVGFDDTELARSLVPPLTTVNAPTEEVGKEGIRKLLQLIHTGKTDPVTTLPTKLVLRRSCGCSYSPAPESWCTGLTQPAHEEARSQG
jgi:LacI family transcriptional regulator